MALCMPVHWQISIFTVHFLHELHCAGGVPVVCLVAGIVLTFWQCPALCTFCTGTDRSAKKFSICIMTTSPPFPSISLQQNQGNAVGYPLVPRHIKSCLWGSFSVLTSRLTIFDNNNVYTKNAKANLFFQYHKVVWVV